MTSVTDHVITKPHFECNKISHNENDITSIIKTTNRQLIESTIDALLTECFNGAFSEVRTLLKSQNVKHTDVNDHQVAPPSTTIIDVSTINVAAPLPDLLYMPPDLILRNEMHVSPQPILVEPTSKSHIHLTLMHDDDNSQLQRGEEISQNDSIQNTIQDKIQDDNLQLENKEASKSDGDSVLKIEENTQVVNFLSVKNANQAKIQDDRQAIKFLISMLEEAWFGAMRQVCLCLQ